jgi:CHAD domain-containing protein
LGYRLIQDEALSRGLRRIARDEIDEAIAHLSEKEPSKRDHSIHEARKSIKKLRGLLRMLTPVPGASTKADVAALGELGRALSEFRDAAALIETVDLLAQHCRSAKVLEQLADLRRTLRRRAEHTCGASDLRGALEHGIVGLRRLKRGTETWKLGDDFDAIAPGLERSFRRGRAALRTAREEQTSERFHDLRKRVKDRWYQVRVLEGLWAHPALTPEKELRDLQEDLGDDHNLEVLRALIPAKSAELREMVDTMQRGLRQKSLETASALYERKACDFVAELSALWDQWSGEKTQPKSVKSVVSRPRVKSAIA